MPAEGMLKEVVRNEVIGPQAVDHPLVQPHAPTAGLLVVLLHDTPLAIQGRVPDAAQVHLAAPAQLLLRGHVIEELLHGRVPPVLLHQAEQDAAPIPVTGHGLAVALQLLEDELHALHIMAEDHEQLLDHPVGMQVVNCLHHMAMQLLQALQLNLPAGIALEGILHVAAALLGGHRHLQDPAAERLQLPPALLGAGRVRLRRPPRALLAAGRALLRQLPGAGLLWWDELGAVPEAVVELLERNVRYIDRVHVVVVVLGLAVHERECAGVQNGDVESIAGGLQDGDVEALLGRLPEARLRRDEL
mmetsp:Transcript_58660/g.162216  ORF Transcript_58660/g.162216 Transcript_58660/m.162216 type:complete len:303 (-) Transcript_58660:952-1860(-)